jgi:hypothetical protein
MGPTLDFQPHFDGFRLAAHGRLAQFPQTDDAGGQWGKWLDCAWPTRVGAVPCGDPDLRQLSQ